MNRQARSLDRLSDEILYCERCGISFLWSSEEQSSKADALAVTRPLFCPGCRQLLPHPDRDRGLVKWFSHKKRYGFITRADSPDLFVHRSEVAPGARLRPDDLVEFSVAQGQRGPAAVHVKLLERSAASKRTNSGAQSG